VRLGWNALQLTNPAGKPFDLVGYLQCLPLDRNPHEVNLRASVGRDEPALAIRLIVQRKTLEAAEATRAALRRSAVRKGKTLDPRGLIAADFMILATSLPKNRYSASAVLAVYRLRWQIELAFKRLKSLLRHRHRPTRHRRHPRAPRRRASTPCQPTAKAKTTHQISRP
jgi:IS4 transposase